MTIKLTKNTDIDMFYTVIGRESSAKMFHQQKKEKCYVMSCYEKKRKKTLTKKKKVQRPSCIIFNSDIYNSDRFSIK